MLWGLKGGRWSSLAVHRTVEPSCARFSHGVSQRRQGAVDPGKAPCHRSALVPGSRSSPVFGCSHSSLDSLAALSRISQAGSWFVTCRWKMAKIIFSFGAK